MDAQRTAHSMPGANEEESNSILEKLENDLRKVVDEWTADGKWLPSLDVARNYVMAKQGVWEKQHGEEAEPEQPDERTGPARHTSELQPEIKALANGVIALDGMVNSAGQLTTVWQDKLDGALDNEDKRRKRQTLEDKHKPVRKRRRMAISLPDAKYMLTSLRSAVKTNHAAHHKDDADGVPRFSTWQQAGARVLATEKASEDWEEPVRALALAEAERKRAACRLVVSAEEAGVQTVAGRIDTAVAQTMGAGVVNATAELVVHHAALTAVVEKLTPHACTNVPEFNALMEQLEELLERVKKAVPMGPEGARWPLDRQSAQTVGPQLIVPHGGGGGDRTATLGALTVAHGGSNRAKRVQTDVDRSMRAGLDGGQLIVKAAEDDVGRAALYLDKTTGKVSLATSGFEDNVVEELARMLPKLSMTKHTEHMRYRRADSGTKLVKTQMINPAVASTATPTITILPLATSSSPSTPATTTQ